MSGYKYHPVSQDLEEVPENRRSMPKPKQSETDCSTFWKKSYTVIYILITIVTLSLGIYDMVALKHIEKDFNNRLKQLESTNLKPRELSPWSEEGSKHFKVGTQLHDQQLLQLEFDQPKNNFKDCKYDKDKCHISSKRKNRKACPTKFFPKEEQVSSVTQQHQVFTFAC